MLVTDNVSGTCRLRMAVRFITCPVFTIDNYVTRLVLKHRIFKLDFKLDLLQMALNFILLQDSCIRPIRVRPSLKNCLLAEPLPCIFCGWVGSRENKLFCIFVFLTLLRNGKIVKIWKRIFWPHFNGKIVIFS